MRCTPAEVWAMAPRDYATVVDVLKQAKKIK